MSYFNKNKLRSNAKNLAHAANVVLNYNRDLLPAGDVHALAETGGELRRLAKKGTEGELETACREAQELLARVAPPVRSPAIRELVETLVVAFGVAMAFRAYFFQPFKIPTGSMQPTLYGIHSVTEADPERGPGFFDKMPFKPLKWIVTGTWYRDVVAAADGSVSVAQDNVNAPGMVLLSVAGKRFKIPQDAFDRRDIKVPNALPASMADNPNPNVRVLYKGYVKKGDRIWSGYITAGDQVFVNRMAWNFRPPRRDDIVVFATSSQELAFSESAARAIASVDSVITKVPNLPLYLVDTPINAGLPTGQHYIKRLVGMPDEDISVRHPHVYADGVKVEGLHGMDRVAAMGPAETAGGVYSGYHATLDEGTPNRSPSLLDTPVKTLHVGDREYLPMGDNTLSSYDGRYWGTVPQAQMLGPGALIWWPVSVRWGSID